MRLLSSMYALVHSQGGPLDKTFTTIWVGTCVWSHSGMYPFYTCQTRRTLRRSASLP